MLEKLVLKTELEQLYSPSDKECTLVEVPPFKIFRVKGRGNPDTQPEYQEAVETVYAASNALREVLKEQEGLEYTIGPLEGRWYADNWQDFVAAAKESWRWIMLIRQPDHITQDQVDEAWERAEKNRPSPAFDLLRYETWEEGRAAQIMHIGPYSSEMPIIEKLQRFIYEQGYQPRSKHHEIYLNDPRSVTPENLRTILRQPVEWHNCEG
jgi:hypothetical protein